MRTRFLVPGLIIAVTAAGCIPDFQAPPPTANIGCRTSADCPTGWTCIEATGKCVEAEKVKDPPSLSGSPSIAPAILKTGATAVITFTSNRELAETPLVVMKMSGLSRIVSFDTGNSTGNNYTFTYTAAGDETQGVENPLTVVMTDKFGSRSAEIALGNLRFDFVTPRMTDAVVLGSPATSGKTVAVEFNVSKALKNDPAVAFTDVGAGSPRPEWWSQSVNRSKGAGTAPLQFVKDPSSTGLHYKYTYVSAGTETQDVDLPILVDLEDEAGNAAAGLEAGKARFDFGKPSIVTESTNKALLTKGTYLEYTFAVNKELGADPVVELIDGSNTRVSMEPGGQSGLTYTYTYKVKETDAEGDRTIRTSLKDVAGNEAADLGALSVKFDFIAPKVSNTGVTPAWKMKGEVDFVLSFDVDKLLEGDPEIVITNTKDPNVTVTKSATCARTYCFEGKTPATGQANFYSVTIKLTDKAGNFTSENIGALEIDNVAPGLAGVQGSPEKAKLGDILVVSITANETLARAPAVKAALNSASLALRERGGVRVSDPEITFTCDKATEQRNNYTCISPAVAAGLSAGAWTLQPMVLEDISGNISLPLNPSPAVNFNIYSVKPDITNVQTNLKTYSKQDGFKTLTLKFDCPVDVGSGLSVKLNDEDITSTCGAWDANNKKYMCTYEVGTTSQGEGTKVISISAQDAAGNKGANSTSVAFDFTGPTLTLSVTPDTRPAKLNENLTITVSTNETLNADGVTLGSGTLDMGNPIKTGNTYTWTRNTASSDQGTYNVTADAKDEVGNPATQKTGTAMVDGVVPAVSNVATNLYVYSRKANFNDLELTFGCPKDVGAGLTVVLDTEDISNKCTWDGINKRYKCVYDVSASALQGGTKFIFVAARDAAGNSSTGSTTAVFDFTPPSLSSPAQFTRDDGNNRANKAIDDIYLNRTRLNGSSGTPSVAITFTVNEALMEDPVLTVGGGLGTVVKNSARSNGEFYWYDFSQGGTEADQDAAVTAAVKDAVGNPGSLALGTIRFDNTRPSMTSAIADAMRYSRIPWGDASHAGPSYEVEIGGTVEAEASLLIYDGPSTTVNAVVGSGIASNTGTVQTVALTTMDRLRVYAALRDRAGNLSGAAAIPVNQVEAVATMGYKVVGSTVENPHRFEARSMFANTLFQQNYLEGSASDGLAAIGPPQLDIVRSGFWVERTYSNGPSKRAAHVMAYDSARGRIVLFGGAYVSTAPLGTWEWDGDRWYDMNPSNPPVARHITSMAYDSKRGKTIMFGGAPYSGSTYLNDTWAWNGTKWTQLSPDTQIPKHYNHAMAYDRDRDRIVLFGGHSGEGTGNWSNDIYEWDGTDWEQKFPQDPKPPPIYGHAMVYDGGRKRTVLFGGYDNMTLLGDTWEWDGTKWEKVSTTGPSPRWGHNMIYDEARRKVLLYGGNPVRDETWEWDGEQKQWTQLHPVHSPGSRAKTMMAYDSARGVSILFGGVAAEVLEDTWMWDGNDWVKLNPAVTPSARNNQAMAYDTASGKVVLFGGQDSTGRRNDTWGWDGMNWGVITPATTSPTARMYHAMAPLGGNVVLFGGEDSTGLLQDTFIWNGTDWSAPTPGNKPTARKYHAMAPLGGNVVLFGGEDATGMLQDTWVWDGTTWNAQSPASSPTARRYHAMASLGGNIVLFGGEDSTGMLQDTWVWDGATWNAQSPATSPPARKHHTMAYNSSLGRVVLMGGEGASGRMDDTWAWDGTNWNQLPKTSTSPVARRYHASAYDGARGKVVIFGGDGASGRLGDTWKWGDGVGARPAGVIQVDFSPFGMDPAAALQSVTAGFYAGGVGHSSGVETNGADLVSWDRGQWKTVATNQYAPGSPGPVSWTTSDAALMPHLFYGPLQNLLIFGVIPSAPDDTGAGKVSVDYAEVRVQYRLP